MSRCSYIPAQGEQLSSVYKRQLSYNGFDMKYWTDKSHFKYHAMLQSVYYAKNGVYKGQNFREAIGYPKENLLVFDSVCGEETIIVKKKNNKNFINIKIKDFVDKFLKLNKQKSKTNHEFININNYEILTIDNNFKVVWKKINQVIRHKVNKKSITLESIGGKHIKITSDHSLIKFKNIDKLESVKGNKIKKNDYVISYDKLLMLNEEDKKYFDFNMLYNKKMKNFRLFITDLELKIMGYVIGDGHVFLNRVSVSGITDKGLDIIWNKFAKKYKKNVTYYPNSHDTTIASTLLSHAFLKLKLGGKSYSKQIPDWILNLPKEKLGNFLNGYFSADGTILVHKTTNYITAISICSVSYKLINDTKLALDKLGIKYNNGHSNKKKTIINNKEYNARKIWNLSIYDTQSITLFKKYIGFTHILKKQKLENSLISNTNKLQHSNLPCEIVEDFCKYGNQTFINKKRVNHKISKSDIGCFRIKNIEHSKFVNEYVYDLSVDDVERFLCSGVLVHNSAGFQIASFKKRGEECNINPIDSLRWQEANCDIAMNLDIPPNLDGNLVYSDFVKALDESVNNFQLFQDERKNYDMKLLNVIHGENLKLLELWWSKVKHFKFDGWAIGIKPPFDPMLQALGFMFLWEKGEYDKETCKHIHFFGTSGKHVCPTLVYCAKHIKQKCTYDSSSYNIGSIYRTYYQPFEIGPSLSFGEKFENINPHIKSLPCMCPVCKSVKNIKDLNKPDIFAGTLISLHNMYQYIQYNNILNSLVEHKDLFLEYIIKMNISKKTLMSIKFIDFAMEKGLSNAVEKYKDWLIPQHIDKTKQRTIFG